MKCNACNLTISDDIFSILNHLWKCDKKIKMNDGKITSSRDELMDFIGDFIGE